MARRGNDSQRGQVYGPATNQRFCWRAGRQGCSYGYARARLTAACVQARAMRSTGSSSWRGPCPSAPSRWRALPRVTSSAACAQSRKTALRSRRQVLKAGQGSPPSQRRCGRRTVYVGRGLCRRFHKKQAVLVSVRLRLLRGRGCQLCRSVMQPRHALCHRTSASTLRLSVKSALLPVSAMTNDALPWRCSSRTYAGRDCVSTAAPAGRECAEHVPSSLRAQRSRCL